MRVLSSTLATAAVALGAFASSAGAATGAPPPPTAPGGQTVTQVAAGLNTPTSFAVGGGSVFEGDGGADSNNGPPNGGVFLLKNGAGTKLAGSPAFVAGLAWHQNALYVSGGAPTSATAATWTLQKWSGWNGSTFAKRTVIYTAPKKFQGFNGIAFGPDGRLYVGVDVGLLNNNDHGPATTSPFLYSILSIKPTGKDLKVFATGIRQPWQFAFAPGSKDPLVSALGQDGGKVKNPLDAILKVNQGDDYGFPSCAHTATNACKAFAKPFKLFSPHTDIMGMAIIGKTLYVTSFSGIGGKGKGGEVFSMPLSGGPLTPVLTGFVAPTVGLGTDGKTLYVGEAGPGLVYSVTP